MANFKHIPVLLNEVIDSLNIKKDGKYVDLTLGRGGHSEAILSHLSSKGRLIGVDQDETAIKESEERLKKNYSNFTLVRSNFRYIDEILNNLGISKVDGILMDLGVSSPQFDDESRGFSYNYDSPLDMRMDQRNMLTAKEIVNSYSLKELTDIFQNYGEDKYSYSVAKNIVKEREKDPIETTFQLVDIIKRSKPAKELKKPGHPAKQIFQALRIAVNDELKVLEETLYKTTALLAKEGRLSVITFHSGEDKIVKKIFKELTVVEGNRYDLPIQNEEKEFVLVNHKVIVPSNEEVINNHRSISAKLRTIMKK